MQEAINNDSLIDKILKSSQSQLFILSKEWYYNLKNNKEILLDENSKINPKPNNVNDDRIIYSSYNEVANEPAYNAFDKKSSTFWTSNTNEQLPAYVGWNFKENIAIYKFSITDRTTFNDTYVCDFILQGYNGNNWEDI